ncbi:MAG: YceI family protein [Thermodesulfobacteriota bacterium]
MKTILRLLALTTCLLLCMTSLSSAEAKHWQIDKDHSNIYFDIRHTYAMVRGQFGNFSGTVVFDPESAEASSVDFKVPVDSINTGITKRDSHLRSEDFFASGQYPYMTFYSTDIEHVKDNRYTVAGELTIKDVTKEVEIPFTYLGLRDNPLEEGQKVAGFEADFTINRLDYNVGTGKFAEMGAVGEKVDILVTLELLKGK